MNFIKKYSENRRIKMGKYIKYEIKGSYKFVLGVLALVLILMTGIYLKGFEN
jgi:hypothetical protein